MDRMDCDDSNMLTITSQQNNIASTLLNLKECILKKDIPNIDFNKKILRQAGIPITEDNLDTLLHLYREYTEHVKFWVMDDGNVWRVTNYNTAAQIHTYLILTNQEDKIEEWEIFCRKLAIAEKVIPME